MRTDDRESAFDLLCHAQEYLDTAIGVHDSSPSAEAEKLEPAEVKREEPAPAASAVAAAPVAAAPTADFTDTPGYSMVDIEHSATAFGETKKSYRAISMSYDAYSRLPAPASAAVAPAASEAVAAADPYSAPAMRVSTSLALDYSDVQMRSSDASAGTSAAHADSTAAADQPRADAKAAAAPAEAPRSPSPARPGVPIAPKHAAKKDLVSLSDLAARQYAELKSRQKGAEKAAAAAAEGAQVQSPAAVPSAPASSRHALHWQVCVCSCLCLMRGGCADRGSEELAALLGARDQAERWEDLRRRYLPVHAQDYRDLQQWSLVRACCSFVLTFAIAASSMNGPRSRKSRVRSITNTGSARSACSRTCPSSGRAQ